MTLLRRVQAPIPFFFLCFFFLQFQAATDPRTGTIDMDLINTGRSALAAAGVRELVDRIRDALATRSGRRTIPLREVLSELTATVC